MKVARRVLLCTIVALAVTAPASAQSRRAALITEAQTTFEADSVIRLLHAALDPALGAPDSLWAVAGYSLAQVLLERQRVDDAALWLRLVVRHAPEHPMNRALYPPAVTTAFDQATQSVTGTRDQGDVETAWRWPAQLGTAQDGTLTVNTGGAPLSVTLEGRGTISAGGSLTLAPGTYTVSASGSDYEPVQVTREVLPGATTELVLHALPLLPASAAAAAGATIVRLTFQQGGQQVCRTGYFATTDGLVLTTAGAVRNASAITATAGTRTYANVTVLATDPDRDLAVLRVPSEGAATPTATTTSNVRTGDYAWSLSADGCPGETTSRTRLASWTSTTAAAALAPPLPATAAGSPLVDRAGLLIGIVTGPERLLPDAFTRDFVDRARAQIAVQLRPSGGGLPWKWLGLGAVAAGVTVAVLGGGGGGGDNGPPPPTTGGIIITFPG
jgi:S1-C subfamily serine protease